MNISLEFKGKIGVVKVVNATVQGKVVATNIGSERFNDQGSSHWIKFTSI